MSDPDLLLLDGELDLIDDACVSRVWPLLSSRTLVVSSSRPDCLSGRCSRFLVLQQARLVVDGPAEAVLDVYDAEVIIQFKLRNNDYDSSTNSSYSHQLATVVLSSFPSASLLPRELYGSDAFSCPPREFSLPRLVLQMGRAKGLLAVEGLTVSLNAVHAASGHTYYP